MKRVQPAISTKELSKPTNEGLSFDEKSSIEEGYLDISMESV